MIMNVLPLLLHCIRPYVGPRLTELCRNKAVLAPRNGEHTRPGECSQADKQSHTHTKQTKPRGCSASIRERQRAQSPRPAHLPLLGLDLGLGALRHHGGRGLASPSHRHPQLAAAPQHCGEITALISCAGPRGSSPEQH